MIHNFSAPRDRRYWQTTAQRLCRNQNIRLKAELLASEESARASQTCLHFISDEQDAMRATDLLKFYQKFSRRHNKAALAKHRLNDHSRNILRSRVTLEKIFQLSRGASHLARRVLCIVRAAITVSVRQAIIFRRERT